MLSREEFLERRKSGIGGSDVAAILGLSPWKTPYQVWLDKTGRSEEQPETERMHFGNVLEQVIADEYARRNNVKVQRRNKLYRHPQHDFLIANIDRYIVGGKGLECKTADRFTANLWGQPEEGDAGIPQYYLTQCHHYMNVTGMREWDLAVLIGGNEYRQYSIHHDAEICEMMTEACAEFWNKNVKEDIPPALTMKDDFSKVFTAKAGASIEANGKIAGIIEQMKEAKAKIKANELLFDELAAEIKNFMGENKILSLNGKPLVTWKQAADRQTVSTDWAAIVAECEIPQSVIDTYTQTFTKQGNRTFLLKK
jgi:putative phage-type endonuclease